MSSLSIIKDELTFLLDFKEVLFVLFVILTVWFIIIPKILRFKLPLVLRLTILVSLLVLEYYLIKFLLIPLVMSKYE